MSLAGGWISWHKKSEGVSLALMVVGQLILLSISSWLNYKIWVGRNWARITGLVLTVLSLLLAFSMLKESLRNTDAFTAILNIVTFGLDAVALYLVFVPGREWYAKR